MSAIPKVALVTGAAKRIGAACARLLHGEGFNLILHYHSSEQQALLLAEALNAVRPGSTSLIKADLLKLQEVESLAKVAGTVWGRVDVLINNASLFYPGAVGQIEERDWDCLLNSNLKAPFFLSQALLPLLKKQRGCIVNLVDIHAERGLVGYPVYSIAKAGLVAMTKCLAKELAPEVRVNAVAPGAILWPDHALSDQQKAEILNKVALQRCGEMNDIAKAVGFLVQDADYMTGQVLTVDGGRMLLS